ncbi:uncharacterized protein [Solanum lycopersicum]|uniref:uncharacterized protein n=1 Tax=Solanum lycopersicum TaxID=4081 RepID=UPI000276557B|nr:uncharacterized protein LOC101264018 [Solanum lycopersicum]
MVSQTQRESSASQSPKRKKRKKKSSSSSDHKPPSRCPKANDNDVYSPGKSVPIWEILKEQYSIDRSKLCGNSSANDKVQAAGKVDGVAARKGVRSVTEGAEMKKPWCQLIAEFPQDPIWRKAYHEFFHTQDSNTNSRSLVKTETIPSTAMLNSTVEIFEQRFMTGAGKNLPEHAMICMINREESVMSELCLDAPAVDDPDKLFANTLFEVVFNESRNLPFILFVKDADKVMAGNAELYSTFKTRLEKLLNNVIIIGSQSA